MSQTKKLFEKSKIQNFRELSLNSWPRSPLKMGIQTNPQQILFKISRFYPCLEGNYTCNDGICKLINLFQTVSMSNKTKNLWNLVPIPFGSRQIFLAIFDHVVRYLAAVIDGKLNDDLRIPPILRNLKLIRIRD